MTFCSCGLIWIVCGSLCWILFFWNTICSAKLEDRWLEKLKIAFILSLQQSNLVVYIVIKLTSKISSLNLLHRVFKEEKLYSSLAWKLKHQYLFQSNHSCKLPEVSSRLATISQTCIKTRGSGWPANIGVDQLQGSHH